MRKRELMFIKILRSPACLWLTCMIAGGGVSIAVSNTWNRPFYVEVPIVEVLEEEDVKGVFRQARAVCEAFGEEERASSLGELLPSAQEAEGDGVAKESKEVIEEADNPRRLNFAFYYDQGAPSEDASQSYAGKVYQALLRQDASWMSEIYSLRHVSPETMAARLGKDKGTVMGIRHLNGIPLDGAENARAIPSWNRFNVTFRNGDGTAVIGHSNIKEIMSLASVYAYFNQEQSYDFLLSYADKLWESSHSYKISISDVYYCQGECQYKDDAGGGEEDEYDLGTAGDGGPNPGSSAEDENGFLSSDDATWQTGKAEAGEGPLDSGVPEREGQAYPEAVPDIRQAGDGQGTGQISHLPIPAAQEAGDGQGTGQISHLPIPAAQEAGDGQGMGQASHEPISDSQPAQEASQGAGQISHLPIPAAQEAADGQGTGQASSEPISDSQPAQEASQGAGQVISAPQSPDGTFVQETPPESRESISAKQPEGQASQAAGQISHEPIPAYQASGRGDSQGMGEAPGAGESAPLAQNAGEAGGISGESVSSSQAADASQQRTRASETGNNNYCQGHIDLNISAVIIGMDGDKSLFTQSAAFPEHEVSGSWNGWDDASKDCAKTIAQQDWYDEYGLTGQDTMFVHNPLSGSEVAHYMSLLPSDTSQERRKVVRQALLSIGCIPYYWGGKPSCGGFEGNNFGTVVSSDEDGRMLRGLDCSGWINWVYWTVFGSSLPAESTSGLMGCGRAVEKKDLQPGDILIRAGKQPHVYLFLAWAPDGSMYLIHETTGNVNNVTIGTYDLDLPYYRCLINEE